jgi:hypothetical protein
MKAVSSMTSADEMGAEPAGPDIVYIAGLDFLHLHGRREVTQFHHNGVSTAQEFKDDYLPGISAIGVADNVLTGLVHGDHQIVGVCFT